jgi:TM2 domain-containing membrane protein YozV
MLVFCLLLIIAAMALGILGVVVKGLLYLLFTGIGLFILAFFFGALWMRRRTRRRRRAR